MMELSSYTGLIAMQLSIYSEHIFDQFLKDASEVQPLLHVAEFIFQKHFIKHDPDLPSLLVSLLVQTKGQQKPTKRWKVIFSKYLVDATVKTEVMIVFLVYLGLNSLFFF